MVLTKAKYKTWIKVRKIITFLSDATVVILLSIGMSENSLILLIMRIGISAVLESLNVWFSPSE